MDAKPFDGRKFIDRASRLQPLAKDTDSDAIREFNRRIEKHRYQHPSATPDPLFLHHTITGADPYAPQAKFAWGGGRQERAILTAAHIVVDITIWPGTVPAGLTVMPMCEFPGCVKFTHLGLFTLQELRSWVSMNKEQKARKAYVRAQMAMQEAHDAERTKPGSYAARELATVAIAAETKYEELQSKYEEMTAKQMVSVVASNLVQEQIAFLAVDRMRQAYDNGMASFEKKNPSSVKSITYDEHCRMVMKADIEFLTQQALRQQRQPSVNP